MVDYSTLCLISVHSLGKICGQNEIRNVVRAIRYKVDGSCLHDVVVCLESVVLSFEMIANS